MLSIVIPVHNEEDNVFPLHERISAAMQDMHEYNEQEVVPTGIAVQLPHMARHALV